MSFYMQCVMPRYYFFFVYFVALFGCYVAFKGFIVLCCKESGKLCVDCFIKKYIYYKSNPELNLLYIDFVLLILDLVLLPTNGSAVEYCQVFRVFFLLCKLNRKEIFNNFIIVMEYFFFGENVYIVFDLNKLLNFQSFTHKRSKFIKYFQTKQNE